MNWSAYWRLMRFDKPVGIYLLWFPTAWALWLANQGRPPLALIALFLCGTILMRAAGCVINDIADRDIDLHVERTKKRPLTAAEISFKEALILLALLFFTSFLVLLALPKECFFYAVFALVIACIYPFCKRFFNTPQLVLGVAFSMGIPMAYVASVGRTSWDCWLLFFINFLWIIAYDTMYAMADKEDDLKIGVHSTAIYFGSAVCLVIALLQAVSHLLWLFLSAKANVFFYVAWGAALGVVFWQQYLIRQKNPQKCFDAFKASSYYGLIMWLSLF